MRKKQFSLTIKKTHKRSKIKSNNSLKKLQQNHKLPKTKPCPTVDCYSKPTIK